MQCLKSPGVITDSGIYMHGVDFLSIYYVTYEYAQNQKLIEIVYFTQQL